MDLPSQSFRLSVAFDTWGQASCRGGWMKFWIQTGQMPAWPEGRQGSRLQRVFPLESGLLSSVCISRAPLTTRMGRVCPSVYLSDHLPKGTSAASEILAIVNKASRCWAFAGDQLTSAPRARASLTALCLVLPLHWPGGPLPRSLGTPLSKMSPENTF